MDMLKAIVFNNKTIAGIPLNYLKRIKFIQNVSNQCGYLKLVSNPESISKIVQGVLNQVYMIVNGEADMLLNQIVPMDDITDVISLSSPISYMESSIYSCVTTSIDKKELQTTGFVIEVWLWVAFSILVLSVFYYFHKGYYTPPITNRRKRRSISTIVVDVFNNVWNLFRYMMQNPPQIRYFDSSGLVICLWQFSCLVLMTLYSGNLKSDLIAIKITFVDSVRDILARPTLKPLTRHSTLVPYILQKSTENQLMSLWIQINQTSSLMPYFFRYSQHVEYMKKCIANKAVYLEDENFVRYQLPLSMLGKQSKIYKGREVLATYSTYYLFRRNATGKWVEDINKGILSFHEMPWYLKGSSRLKIISRRKGINKILDIFWNEKSKPMVKNIRRIELRELRLVFKLFFFGLALSFAAFTLEIICDFYEFNKRSRYTRRKRTMY